MASIRRTSSIIFMSLVIGGSRILAAAPAGSAAWRTEPQVSLITILPGKALYSSFGHTAIRVLDPKAGSDVLYNYGLSENPFDLTFAARMLVGRMEFTVGVLDTKSELQFYSQDENRTIIEQRLDLDEAQKESMLSALETNALPENRIYNYRYFSDNCATRVWKIFKTLDSDAPVFLPEELMNWTAGIAKSGTKSETKLVDSTKTLYEARPERKKATGITPLVAAIALLAIALALGLFMRKDNPTAICFDAILFGAAAVVCLAILLFWIAAGYGEVGPNLNLLWAIPLPLVALLRGRKPSGARAAMILFRITAVAAALVAILGGLGIQSISPAIRFIALAIALRCLVRGLDESTSALPIARSR